MTKTVKTKNAGQSADAVANRRSYMQKDDRRRMLLEQAALIVESRDWSELTMSALATQAGISRQTIYQHFPNVEALLTETAEHMFAELWERTAAIINDPNLSLGKAVKETAILSLNLSDGMGDALGEVIVGGSRASSELMAFSKHIRGLVIELWSPRVTKDLGLKKPAARNLIWMLLMAFWGLRQLIRDGLVARKQALEQFEEMVRRAVKSQD